MEAGDYARFLSPDRRIDATLPPEESWWAWRGQDIHIARARRADAGARVLLVHGVGGHSGALWPFGSLLAHRGLDVAAPDLPLYGRTVCSSRESVRYGDWVEMLVDLVEAEHDDRPLILLGASMGGMLAWEVAARSGQRVAAVAATCLLDPRDWRTAARITRFGALGIAGPYLASIITEPVASRMTPVSKVAKLSKMSRNAELSRLCIADERGGGARVPLGFLASYLKYRHIAPESASTPITLVHPAADEWTPVTLSMRTLRRATPARHVVLLRECGHFPIEEPGVGDLVETIIDIARTSRQRPVR